MQTVTLTFDLATWLLFATNCPVMVIICAKFYFQTPPFTAKLCPGHDSGTHTHMDRVKSRKENPQKLTQLNSRSHPRHLVGKRTAQKDITIDTTSDSQVNSNFPNRWSPASLTFNNYFYLSLYQI